MIKLEVSKEQNFKQYIRERLHAYNREKCAYIAQNSKIEPSNEFQNCHVILKEDETIIGGAIGHIAYAWYFLDDLWVEETYRKQGLGTKLIKKIEEVVKKEQLMGVRMETWNFRARGFYEKLGYEVYATFEDCPPGTVDYFLRKKIK